MYPPAVADRYPDRVAYIMAGSGETLTYSQLDRESNRLAHLFRQHGIRGGDTVAALNHAGVADDFSYVSTAGGAFLEWMEGKPLPGVEVLRVRTSI